MADLNIGHYTGQRRKAALRRGEYCKGAPTYRRQRVARLRVIVVRRGALRTAEKSTLCSQILRISLDSSKIVLIVEESGAKWLIVAESRGQ